MDSSTHSKQLVECVSQENNQDTAMIPPPISSKQQQLQSIPINPHKAVEFSEKEKEDYYSVTGYDKEIRSVYSFPVEQGKRYHFKLTFRCSAKQRLLFGIKCYDKDMEEIGGDRYGRVPNSQVIFLSFDASARVLKVTESSKGNLIFWKQFDKNSPTNQQMAYWRMIGVYEGIDYTLERPKYKSILRYSTTYYSTNETDSVYTTTNPEKGEIYLTDAGVAQVKRYLASGGKLMSGSTVLMNHTSGGNNIYFDTGGEIDNRNWETIETSAMFEKSQGTLEFRIGTKYIQPVILMNWNYGINSPAVTHPDASFDWKDCFISCD